jgi:hypothetical protein
MSGLFRRTRYLQRLFPYDRSAGIVAVPDDHLAIEFARKRDDLSMGQFVGRAAETGLQFAPSPLVVEIALGATNQRLIPVLRVERFLDLARHYSEAGQPRRDPPTKPPHLAAGMLPRLIHPKPHLRPLLCTTGRFRTALSYRYNLNFLRFACFLAEREGFEPPIGLHLCRISSAVHSTTLPPLQAP